MPRPKHDTEALRRLAGVPVDAFLDFKQGDRVMTPEGYPGTVDDSNEGPGGLSSYFVTLDNGMGGGEYGEGELVPLNQSTSSTTAVERTAADDYPELGNILSERPPLQFSVPATQYWGMSHVAAKQADLEDDNPEGYYCTDGSGEYDGPYNSAEEAGQAAGLDQWVVYWDGSTAENVDPYADRGKRAGLGPKAAGSTEDGDPPPLMHISIVFPIKNDASPIPEHLEGAGEQGWQDGNVDARTKAARDYQSDDPAYREGYNLGWAQGIEVAVPGPPELSDETEKRLAVTRLATSLMEHPEAWNSQKQQFAATGPDGISYQPEEVGGGKKVDCVLLRKGGTLVGILYHYPQDIPPYEKAGNVNVIVDPAHRKQGVATALMQWARDRWEIDFDAQDYTPAGQAFIDAFQHKHGAIWDEPTKNWGGPSRNWSYDWCRFRKNSHCYFSKTLDKEASQTEGYAVWVPEDRGHCPRQKWDQQKACPIGEPGPHVPGGLIDATTPYDQGGQRGGIPSHATLLPIVEVTGVQKTADEDQCPRCSDSALMSEGSYTCQNCGLNFADPNKTAKVATWQDVRDKAKRIRSEGGVRILSTAGGAVTAEVKGDTHVYQTRITFVPGKKSLAFWECGCAWSAYSWGRKGKFKKYEGRSCSHAYALQLEAQSRNMFGREITLDSKQPHWMDPTIPTKQHGDWDRDKGRYAAMTPSEWKSIEGGAVAHLWKDGVPLCGARTRGLGPTDREPVSRCPDCLHEQRKASKTAFNFKEFFARIRGQVKKVWITPAGITEPGINRPPIDEPVYYPTYHPTKGLSLSDGRTAAMTTEPLPQITAGMDPEISAKTIAALAARYEPTVSDLMQTLAAENGGQLVDYKYRLKEGWINDDGSRHDGMPRMVQKITQYMERHGVTASTAALKMGDSLRYTVEFPASQYTAGVKLFFDVFPRNRVQIVERKNYWQRGDTYQGFNTTERYRGHPFEVQFHTPDSYAAKFKTHDMYAEYRSLPLSAEERRHEIFKAMCDIVDAIPVPSGILSVPDLTMQTGKHASTQRTAMSPMHEGFVYYVHTDIDGQIIDVLRHYNNTPAKQNRIERWLNGHWVMDNSYADVIFGGKGAMQVSKEEADKAIIEMVAGYAPTAYASLQNQASVADRGDDQWGIWAEGADTDLTGLLPGEPSYDWNPVVWAGPNGQHGLGEAFALMPDPETPPAPEEPEPALPETYSDDDLTAAAAKVAVGLMTDAKAPLALPQGGWMYGVGRDDVARCPIHSTSADHYTDNGKSCKCKTAASDVPYGETPEAKEWAKTRENVTYTDGSRVQEGDSIRYHQAPGGLMSHGDWQYGTAVYLPGSKELVLKGDDGRHYNLYSHVIERAEKTASVEQAADLLAQHDARVAAAAQGDATGPDPFAHLMSGGEASNDVAQMAQQYLAQNQKEAVKTYSPAEKQALIDEGEGEQAGNFDSLDIAGTHYEALDQARSNQPGPDENWMW